MRERAWLFLAYGDDRAYGGNNGYQDGFDRYSYDSHVPNWKQVKVGDLAVIAGRDGRRGPPTVVGLARIEDLRIAPAIKEVGRCPICAHPRFKARTTKTPKFRCDHGHEFDAPALEEVPVTGVMAIFGDTYRAASGAMSTGELRAAQVNRGDGNSIRPLDAEVLSRHLSWDRALQLVLSPGGYPDPEAAAKVDKAAIPLALAIAQERYFGLRVEVMDHSNLGYDLAVLDGSTLVRYIEVKSTTRHDGGFFMSDYQREFSIIHASVYSLLVLAGLDPARGSCRPFWFDGAVSANLQLRPVQWRGALQPD